MPQSANPADWCGSIYVGLFVKRTKEDREKKKRKKQKKQKAIKKNK